MKKSVLVLFCIMTIIGIAGFFGLSMGGSRPSSYRKPRSVKDINMSVIIPGSEPANALYLVDQYTPNNLGKREAKAVLTLDEKKDVKFIGRKNYDNVFYSSSMPRVARVDDNGVISAVSEGTSKITVHVDNENSSMDIVVVGKNTPCCSITNQDRTEAAHIIHVGDVVDYCFIGCTEYKNAKSKAVYWDSTNDGVFACFDSTAGKFIAVHPGTAYVKVAVVCDNKVCHTGIIKVSVKQ